MTTTLTPYGAQKSNVRDACLQLLKFWTHSLREGAAVLGLMTSIFPGVVYGPLHYRTLKIEKFLALKINKRNFDGFMTVSSKATSDINWWIKSLPGA